MPTMPLMTLLHTPLKAILPLAAVLFAIQAQAGGLPRPPGLGERDGESSIAVDINAAGPVVGSAQNSDGRWRAFIHPAGLAMRDLGTLGGRSSYGAGINSAGQVVGYADTGDDYFHAFWSDGGGAPVDLGTLGGKVSYANAINKHGQVVGAAALANGYRHAFLYQADGGMRDIGTLGGRSSAATAINDEGVVVGASETPERRWHAFMMKDGRMLDLGALIGYGASFATGVNNAGHVVGTIQVGDERQSFVYRDGRMLIHRGGKGLYLVNAINDEEQVIGATKYNPKRLVAAAMPSNRPVVVTRGGEHFLDMMAAVVLSMLALVVYRRRYRGVSFAAIRIRF